jgi:hypothetical protein
MLSSGHVPFFMFTAVSALYYTAYVILPVFLDTFT